MGDETLQHYQGQVINRVEMTGTCICYSIIYMNDSSDPAGPAELSQQLGGVELTLHMQSVLSVNESSDLTGFANAGQE